MLKKDAGLKTVRAGKRGLMLLSAALLCLGACTPAVSAPASVEATPVPPPAVAIFEIAEPETGETPTVAVPVETETPAAPDWDTLSAALSDVSQNYHAGTAGCSLTAARLAGTLLDWYAAAKPAPDALKAAAEGFVSGLDASMAALLPGQLRDIYDAACQLTGETAEDFLEAAGYEPASFPWPEADVDALFAGLGVDTKTDGAA